MANRDESDLQIIEVKGSLLAEQARRPLPAMLERSAPTREEALEGLRSVRGAASVIKRLPALESVTAWGETAFWSVRESKGAAFDPCFWDSDFTPGFSVGFAYDNNVVMFWATELLEGLEGIITPPQNLTGQLWCDLAVPADGYYLFVAQVAQNGEPPDYVATVEFCLDSSSLGQRQLVAGGGYEQYFVFVLAAGIHRFTIKQVSGVFHFRTLTAWHIPGPMTEGA